MTEANWDEMIDGLEALTVDAVAKQDGQVGAVSAAIEYATGALGAARDYWTRGRLAGEVPAGSDRAEAVIDALTQCMVLTMEASLLLGGTPLADVERYIADTVEWVKSRT